MSDIARHLRPPYSCNLNRRHTQNLGASNSSQSAPDSWNQGHPQAAHWIATNAAITEHLQRTFAIIGFLKTHQTDCKMNVTPFRNEATDHNRLLKATEISLFIPRKLLHPYCPPGGVIIQNYHTYEYITIPSRTVFEHLTKAIPLCNNNCTIYYMPSVHINVL